MNDYLVGLFFTLAGGLAYYFYTEITHSPVSIPSLALFSSIIAIIILAIIHVRNLYKIQYQALTVPILIGLFAMLALFSRFLEPTPRPITITPEQPTILSPTVVASRVAPVTQLDATLSATPSTSIPTFPPSLTTQISWGYERGGCDPGNTITDIRISRPGEVDIFGRVKTLDRDHVLEEYQLFWASGRNPIRMNPIGTIYTNEVPVASRLETWNIANVPKSEDYTIRLRVKWRVGQFYDCDVWVKLGS
ncbi:MAG: hypothetical protein HY276_09220 [Ignavibacteriales bacterium]|nr:hypothetical protein [Ignavibacteriales bacterium]